VRVQFAQGLHHRGLALPQVRQVHALVVLLSHSAPHLLLLKLQRLFQQRQQQRKGSPPAHYLADSLQLSHHFGHHCSLVENHF
jgi:hypothetical protein